MKRTLLILSLAAFCGTSSAESLPHDDLKVAWDKALSAIEKGRPRLDVAKDLEAAMAKTPASWWHDHANALVQDLRASDVKLRQLPEDRASAESSPWLWLAESTIPHYFYNPANNASLSKKLRCLPNDPAARVLAADERCIPGLISMLTDMSPTRMQDILSREDQAFRVCDLALALLEHRTMCSFCEQTFCFGPLSSQSDEVRLAAQQDARAWWQECERLAPNTRIQHRLPSAGFYGQIRMCDMLIETGTADDRQYARTQLRRIVDANYLPGAVRAGEVLMKLGDTYCLDVVDQKLGERFAESATSYDVDSSIIFFVIQHGRSQDWQVLTECALAQLEAGDAGGGHFILPAVIDAITAESSPHAVPCLALVLRMEQLGLGPRLFHGKKESRSPLWKALRLVQQMTGTPLGIPATDPGPDEEQVLIGKIAAWWTSSGQAEYTRAAIEQRIKTSDKQ